MNQGIYEELIIQLVSENLNKLEKDKFASYFANTLVLFLMVYAIINIIIYSFIEFKKLLYSL